MEVPERHHLSRSLVSHYWGYMTYNYFCYNKTHNESLEAVYFNSMEEAVFVFILILCGRRRETREPTFCIKIPQIKYLSTFWI